MRLIEFCILVECYVRKYRGLIELCSIKEGSLFEFRFPEFCKLAEFCVRKSRDLIELSSNKVGTTG